MYNEKETMETFDEQGYVVVFGNKISIPYPLLAFAYITYTTNLDLDGSTQGTLVVWMPTATYVSNSYSSIYPIFFPCVFLRND